MAKKRNAPQITVTMQPEVLAQVDARSRYRSTQINRDLEAYYALMRAVRAELRLTLGKREQAALLAAMRWAGSELVVDAAAVPEAVRDWCAALSPIQRLAVMDAARRYHYQRRRGREPEPRLFEENGE